MAAVLKQPIAGLALLDLMLIPSSHIWLGALGGIAKRAEGEGDCGTEYPQAAATKRTADSLCFPWISVARYRMSDHLNLEKSVSASV